MFMALMNEYGSWEDVMSQSNPDNRNMGAQVTPLRIANAAQSVRHVFIRDLLLNAHIGVHRHEKGRSQPVRINIDLTVREGGPDAGDDLDNVVCYEQVVDKVKELVESQHINLAETMAERIATRCFEDVRVLVARVRLEKLTVIAEAASVGVEIERTRPDFNSL